MNNNKLTDEEKLIIEKALDLYRLEGEWWLESGKISRDKIARITKQIRELETKVWRLDK